MGGQDTASQLTHTHRASSNHLTFLFWGACLPTGRGGPSEAVSDPCPPAQPIITTPRWGRGPGRPVRAFPWDSMELTEPYPRPPTRGWKASAWSCPSRRDSGLEDRAQCPGRGQRGGLGSCWFQTSPCPCEPTFPSFKVEMDFCLLALVIFLILFFSLE